MSAGEPLDPDLAPAPRPSLLLLVAVIAAGGIIGSELRWGTGRLLPTTPGDFPWATLIVNVVAGLGIGALMATLRRYEGLSPLVRPFVGTGVMGGLSTFSTSSTDTFALIDHGRVGVAVLYAAVTLVAALGATILGTVLVAAFAPS